MFISHLDHHPKEACDFILWSCLKSKIYAQKPRRDVEELKTKFEMKLSLTLRELIRRVMENIRERCEKCLRQDSGHREVKQFKK